MSIFKGLLIGLFVLIGIILTSNLEKGIQLYEPDQLAILVRPTLELQPVLQRYPELVAIRAEEGIVRIPYGETVTYTTRLQKEPEVGLVQTVPAEPAFNLKTYWHNIQKTLTQYAHGDLGTFTYTNRPDRDYPVTTLLWKMTLHSLSYLLPGLLLAIVLGISLALLAVWKPKLGRILDTGQSLLLALPDFCVVLLLQFGSIFLTKIAGHNIIVIMQFGDNIPFLIPFLALTLLPTALIYGSLRIAFERESEEDYIKTAYMKGLTRRIVIVRHMFRNTWEDLFAVLPRSVSVAITSMAVTEVMCGIFRLGGYALNNDMLRVTSLPTTCAILAAVAMLFYALLALLRRRIIVNTKEGC